MSTTENRPAKPAEPMAYLLGLVNRLGGLELLDRLQLRGTTEKVLFTSVKTGFRTIAATQRTFKKVSGGNKKPARLGPATPTGLFDLDPTEDQQMLVDVVREFAAEMVRPLGKDADHECATPKEVLATAAELGVTQVSVPEEAGGFATERSTTTNVLVGEALAHGDMGMAVACLAPAAVSTALSLWGDATQQATYLPHFVGDAPPAAAFTLLEPKPLFDPFTLDTTATPTGGSYLLDGVKSLVPRAADAELFLVGANVPGEGPALFLVESGTQGITIESEPAMGLRAASMGRLILEGVRVPASARLGTKEENPYRDAVRQSRLAWCSMSLGTGQAVLDYVIPYVNDRVAFGEPISHRQSVAFLVADIAIELAGMRLVTLRAASRAEADKSFAREVALARHLCAEKGMWIGSTGVQLLGGHGFVKEHPVERWYRDLRATGLMEGVLLA